MNARELADLIDKHAQLLDNLTDFPKGVRDIKESATMLRQQADRIAELEAKLQLHDAMDKQCQSLMKQVKEITNEQ